MIASPNSHKRFIQFCLYSLSIHQTYVQDLAAKEADALYELIVVQKGHIYVCGDVTMAEHVYLTIRYVQALLAHSTITYFITLFSNKCLLLTY